MQRRKLLGGAVALVAVVAGGGFALKTRADARALDTEARATKLLDDRYRDVYGARETTGWVRPVLRPPVLDENAATIRRAAVDKITKLPEPSGRDPQDIATSISLAIKDGTPLSPAAQAFVVREVAGLAELRRATHGRYAFTHVDPHERTTVSAIPSAMLGAAKILLASATLEPAEECVRIGADAIRLGQDMAPGAFLTSAIIGQVIIKLTVPLVIRCGERLGAVQREDAIKELTVLAENPPPFGDVLDNEWLFMAYGTMNAARESGADGVRIRWKTWEAVDAIVASPPSFANMLSAGYPASFGSLATFDHQFDGSDNPILQLARPNLLRYAQEDARTQAWVRALVIALTIQGEGRTLGPKTHTALESPSLRDPFTGRPLVATKEGDGVVVISAQTPPQDTGAPDKEPVRAVLPVPTVPLDLPRPPGGRVTAPD